MRARWVLGAETQSRNPGMKGEDEENPHMPIAPKLQFDPAGERHVWF
jgi:hypothetical protein